jgi:hypothetical protein
MVDEAFKRYKENEAKKTQIPNPPPVTTATASTAAPIATQ